MATRFSRRLNESKFEKLGEHILDTFEKFEYWVGLSRSPKILTSIETIDRGVGGRYHVKVSMYARK